MSSKKKPKNRDGSIQLAIAGEIRLSTSSIPSKTIYTRKEKHKLKEQ